MTTVAHLLNQKGHNIESIAPGATVYEAIKRMADLDIGALVVIEDEHVVGMITERDYSRNVFLKGKASRTGVVGVGDGLVPPDEAAARARTAALNGLAAVASVAGDLDRVERVVKVVVFVASDQSAPPSSLRHSRGAERGSSPVTCEG